MGKYQFYQDRKVTSWERDYFTVEAASYKDAEPLSVHGSVRMFLISLTAVCVTTNGVRWPTHRNVCSRTKMAAVRQSRYIILKEKLL